MIVCRSSAVNDTRIFKGPQLTKHEDQIRTTHKGWFKTVREDPFGRKVLDIIEEVIIVILLLGGIAIVHKILNWWLGNDYKLLDRIPIRYIIDVGHGLAVIRFLLEIVRDISDILRAIKKGAPRKE